MKTQEGKRFPVNLVDPAHTVPQSDREIQPRTRKRQTRGEKGKGQAEGGSKSHSFWEVPSAVGAASLRSQASGACRGRSDGAFCFSVGECYGDSTSPFPPAGRAASRCPPGRQSGSSVGLSEFHAIPHHLRTDRSVRILEFLLEKALCEFCWVQAGPLWQC